jgi:Cft2 family RNA processing exonuclease
MNPYPIDVTGAGAVLLGERIACDGFHSNSQCRVQTHVHEDHMWEFDTSKGTQTIVMSTATHQLLLNERDADLVIRENLVPVEYGHSVLVDGQSIRLLPNGHMLGSCQVAVELDTGLRVGYSGDFAWPMDEVMEVDALVLDSTCGSPQLVRAYSQAEVESRLLDIISDRLRFGPVVVKGHSGTLERAVQILSGRLSCTLIASSRLVSEISVYERFGYGTDGIYVLNSSEALAAMEGGRYVRLVGKGDTHLVDYPSMSVVTLSAYISGDDPVLPFSERSYRVALTNHADFAGTLEYVKATGAKYVVTDNTRGHHAVELAVEIVSRLGIRAVASHGTATYEWGA